MDYLNDYDWSSYETQLSDTYGTSNSMDGFTAGFLGSFLVTYLIFIVAIAALMIAAFWKLFKKAGRNGWEAIIPIYNMWVLFEISGLKGWYVLLGLIPFVGAIILFVFQIMAYINLAKAFGKDGGYAVGLILLTVIFLPMLAFGKATYDPSVLPQQNA